MSTTKTRKPFGLLSMGILIGLTLTIAGPFVMTPTSAAGSLTLSVTSGVTGTKISVSGTGIHYADFPYGIPSSGALWFDIDRDLTFETGEPIVTVAINPDGSFTGYELTVPITPEGGNNLGATTYYVVLDAGGGNHEAEAPFKVTSPAPMLSLSESCGVKQVTVTGINFQPTIPNDWITPYSLYGYVWFDKDNEGDRDEPSIRVYTDKSGHLKGPITLTVPSISLSGTYYIRTDLPASPSYGDNNGNEAAAKFYGPALCAKPML